MLLISSCSPIFLAGIKLVAVGQLVAMGVVDCNQNVLTTGASGPWAGHSMHLADAWVPRLGPKI